MVKARGFGREREVVLDADSELPESERTEFRHKIPRHGAELGLSELDEKDAVGVYNAMRDVVRLHLTGWDLKHADGTPVPFETDDDGLPTDDTLEELDLSDLRELAIKIIRSGQLTNDDRGKSDA